MMKRGVLALVMGILIGFVGCKKNEDNPVTTPTEDPNYVNANGIKGGTGYDKFWVSEAGFDQNDTAKINVISAKPDFFRCKQCHGWELLGRSGGYINRGPSTSRPNIAAVNLFAAAKSKTSQELFTLIKTGSTPSNRRSYTADLSTYNPSTNSTIGDQMPNYGGILTDGQIWDLVKFLREEAVDVSLLYDATLSGTYPTGSITVSNLGKDGSATAGDTFFSSNCATCHGANGKAFLVDGNAYTVGRHMRSKPWEDQHKVKYGNPGTSMVPMAATISDLKNLYKAIADTVKYPNN